MTVTLGAFDLEIDTIPGTHDGAMTFTFGGLQVAMTSGPPAAALYDEHNEWVANLPNAVIANWQVALSQPGAMSCSLPMDDATTALATKKRFIKVFYRGKARIVIRIDGSSIQVAKDGRRWRVFSDRPGALNMLAEVATFPEIGLDKAASSQRTFGFMSRFGPWYDSGNWTRAIGYAYLDETDNKRGKPVGLAGPNPWWIAKRGPHNVEPSGHTQYFRKEFTTSTADLMCQVLATGDNNVTVWMDGEKIITPDMQQGLTWKVLARVVRSLSIGKHVLAAKVVNAASHGYNPVGFILTLQQVNAAGDVIPGPPLMNTNRYWVISDVYPGFRRGDVILTLFKDAVARASAAGQWFQAVNTLSCGFDHLRDSDGVWWADAPDEYTFDAGSSLLSAIEQLCERDIDVVLDPGPMVVNAYNLLGTDKSADVFLDVGVDVTGALLNHSIDVAEARDNTALVQLADGRWIVTQDADSVAEIGRVEVGLALGSTSDTASAVDIAHGHFAESANTTYTFTTTVSDLDGQQPLVDFDLGDQISVTDEFATGYYKVRVMAMTFTPQPTGRVKVDVELALDLTP